MSPREYPVGLNADQIRLIADALAAAVVPCDKEDAERMFALALMFSGLHQTVSELEPIARI